MLKWFQNMSKATSEATLTARVPDDVEVGEDVEDVEEDIKDSVGGGLEEGVDDYEG